MRFALWLEDQAAVDSLNELLIDIVFFFYLENKWLKEIDRIDKSGVSIEQVNKAEADFDQMTMLMSYDRKDSPIDNLDQIPKLIRNVFNYLQPFMPKDLFDEIYGILVKTRQERINRIFDEINGLADMFDLPPMPEVQEKFMKFAGWTNRSQFWEISEFATSKIESIIEGIGNGRSPTTSLFAIKNYYLPKAFSAGGVLDISDFFEKVIQAYKDFKRQEFGNSP